MKRSQQSRTALGSQVLLTLVLENDQDPDPFFHELWQTIDDFEARFSRFRSTSELSALNTRAGTLLTVSPELSKLLKTCIRFAKDTNGLFTPFILPALQQAGYIGSWPQPGNYDPSLDFRKRTDLISINKLRVTKDTALIPENTALDFGGIGKGYLLDLLGKQLQEKQIANYWLSLGGDILCAGVDSTNDPWSIGVQDAMRKDKLVASIEHSKPTKFAIATSGITKRKGTQDGKDWHHIIDPRLGVPAQTDIATVTIVCQSATDADVYAKCLVILGSKQAQAFMEQHPAITQCYMQAISGNTIHLETERIASA